MGQQQPVQPSGSGTPDSPLSQSRPLGDYMTNRPPKISSDHDANGLLTYRGRKYAEIQDGGIVMVGIGSDGTVRAKLANEKNDNASGPVLHRNPDDNTWSDTPSDTGNPSRVGNPQPSGLKDGGVTYYQASKSQLESYGEAAKQIGEMKVPLMHQKNDPNSRLFVAAFDGTGNDGNAEVLGRSNVAEIAEQYQYASYQDPNVAVSYIKGPGTQNNPIVNVVDKATGKTYPDRLQKMNVALQAKAQAWFDENPNIRISVVDLGFSRGAEQAAGFARMIEDNGIMVRDRSGKEINLVQSKQVIQAAALFDPVGTGTPHKNDRSLPNSVVTGLQIRAKDEKRDQFKDTEIITHTEPNMPFQVVEVNGSHSDIGGGYEQNGLAIRNGNLMREYLNSLTDVKLNMLPEPAEGHPSNVVHRSEEGFPSPIYTTKYFDENQGRGSVRNSVDHNFSRARPAPSIEPWSGLEWKLEYLPVGQNLSERSKDLITSGRTALNDLNGQLGPSDKWADEPRSRIGAFSVYATRQAGMDKIARMEITGRGENAEITVYDSHGQEVRFKVTDALKDSENTTLRRIADFDTDSRQAR
ncbi:phospholipase effector Tle1 domain-containing protein [Burkholderia ambifaria]|uniref:T6SS Phospholipase effector Tle1-like catalytic domain-containing protein n=1 Tax=Burkholderia ambifaria MEX-5 TaxID=396597 RepID=B1TF68_9BURK|nr:DUF2235 domain-containing protein [Burkholderia ambifaria]EDT37790.1 hypothetical protein BamMEX5DRAFT_6434 [Burkholderia ambifaria MEX-5]